MPPLMRMYTKLVRWSGVACKHWDLNYTAVFPQAIIKLLDVCLLSYKPVEIKRGMIFWAFYPLPSFSCSLLLPHFYLFFCKMNLYRTTMKNSPFQHYLSVFRQVHPKSNRAQTNIIPWNSFMKFRLSVCFLIKRQTKSASEVVSAVSEVKCLLFFIFSHKVRLVVTTDKMNMLLAKHITTRPTVYLPIFKVTQFWPK
jgi:hypothetical protein